MTNPSQAGISLRQCVWWAFWRNVSVCMLKQVLCVVLVTIMLLLVTQTLIQLYHEIPVLCEYYSKWLRRWEGIIITDDIQCVCLRSGKPSALSHKTLCGVPWKPHSCLAVWLFRKILLWLCRGGSDILARATIYIPVVGWTFLLWWTPSPCFLLDISDLLTSLLMWCCDMYSEREAEAVTPLTCDLQWQHAPSWKTPFGLDIIVWLALCNLSVPEWGRRLSEPHVYFTDQWQTPIIAFWHCLLCVM